MDSQASPFTTPKMTERLIGQVITVSLETVKIVRTLPLLGRPV
jgi:hypothetical protein